MEKIVDISDSVDKNEVNQMLEEGWKVKFMIPLRTEHFCYAMLCLTNENEEIPK